MAEHKTDMSQREDLMLDEMFAASRAMIRCQQLI